MIHRLLRLAAIGAILGVAYGWSTRSGAQEPGEYATGGVVQTGAQSGNGIMCRPWEYGNPDLFYNFYVPNNCGGVPAAMYQAPIPVPQVVGQTYYTYQPLMPHEFMYPHHRTYHRVYDEGRGLDRTKVVWYSNPVATVVKDIRCAIKIPR